MVDPQMEEAMVKDPKNFEEFKKTLEDNGVDTSKIKESYQSPTPIHRHSACDVYRNNKSFLKKLSIRSQYDTMYEEIRKEYGTDKLEEADKKFKESNADLPTGWYNKLDKIYQSFRHVFNK